MGLQQRLRELRTKHNLTLKRAAKRANISLSFWADLESGRRQPSLDTLKVIAGAFGVTTDYLLGLQMHITVEGTERLAELPPDAQKCVEDLIEYLLRSAERKGDG